MPKAGCGRIIFVTDDKESDPVRDYLSAIGRKGGSKPTDKLKGVAALSEKERKKRAKAAAAARWGKKAAKKKTDRGRNDAGL
jgi:hypothetical protein